MLPQLKRGSGDNWQGVKSGYRVHARVLDNTKLAGGGVEAAHEVANQTHYSIPLLLFLVLWLAVRCSSVPLSNHSRGPSRLVDSSLLFLRWTRRYRTFRLRAAW